MLFAIELIAPLLPKSSINAPYLFKESKLHYMHVFSIFETIF